MSDEVQAEIDAARAELAQAEAALAEKPDPETPPTDDFTALDAALKGLGLDPRNGRPPGSDEGLDASRAQMLREAQLRLKLPVTGLADGETLKALGVG